MSYRTDELRQEGKEFKKLSPEEKRKRWDEDEKELEELGFKIGKRTGSSITLTLPKTQDASVVEPKPDCTENTMIRSEESRREEKMKRALERMSRHREVHDAQFFAEGEYMYMDNDAIFEEPYRDSDYESPYDSPFYDDNLDMDQQSPEFWDDIL